MAVVHKLGWLRTTLCGIATDFGTSRPCGGHVTTDDEQVSCRRCLKSMGHRDLTTAALVAWLDRLDRGIAVRVALAARLRAELAQRKEQNHEQRSNRSG